MSIVTPIVCGVFGSCLVMQCAVSFLVWQSSRCEERSDCFAFIVFLLLRDFWCSVSLHRGAEG